MAKPQKIILDTATMKLVAALSTITAAHVMLQLYNRGVFSNEDCEAVFAGLAGSSFGDPALDAMAKSLAKTLRDQVVDLRMN